MIKLLLQRFGIQVQAVYFVCENERFTQIRLEFRHRRVRRRTVELTLDFRQDAVNHGCVAGRLGGIFIAVRFPQAEHRIVSFLIRPGMAELPDSVKHFVRI